MHIVSRLSVPRVRGTARPAIEAGAHRAERMVALAVAPVMAGPTEYPEVGWAECEGGVIEVWLDVVDDGGVLRQIYPLVACAASAASTLDGGSTCRLPFP